MDVSMEPGGMAKLNFRRLMAEFRKVQNAMKAEEMPFLLRCEPDDDNLMKWLVDMKFRPDSPLQQSLNSLAETLIDESRSALTLKVHFPPEFPNAPPEIWLQRPRLKYKSATPVTFGGKVCSNTLTSSGWASTTSMQMVLTEVNDLLVEAGAEVDITVSVKSKHYPQAPPMLDRTKSANFPTSNDFKKDKVTVISAFEAAAFFGDALFSIETTDRIGLSMDLANELYGRAERGGEQLDLPLMFEVKTSRGRKTHCTIKEFYRGLPQEIVVMPKWVMEDLFISERDTVTIRGVVLPLIQSVSIQPHHVEFYEAMAEMKSAGQDGVKILNDALSRFSALTEDTTIPVEIGSKSHDVQIVHVEPKAAVRIIDQDMTHFFEFRVNLVESPELEGEEAAKERQAELLERWKKKQDEKAAEDRMSGERREAALRARYEHILNSARTVAGADDGQEGEVEVMVRLPGGQRLTGKFRDGAPVEALVALVLGSEWADACSPWGVQLASAFPRKIFAAGDCITKDMHRSAVSVQQERAPDDEDELYEAAGVSGTWGNPDVEEDEHTEPVFDEMALQHNTQYWFEVQRFIQKGTPLEEARRRVDAGEIVPFTPGDLRRAEAASLPPPARLRARPAAPAPPAPASSSRDRQILDVVGFTALDPDAAAALLETNDWNTDRAVNTFFDLMAAR